MILTVYTMHWLYFILFKKKKKLVEVLTPQKKMFERLLGWCSVSVHFSIVAEHLTERKEPWKFCLTYHYNEHQITTICYWQSNAFTIISCYYEHNNGGFLQCFESEKKLIIFSEVTDTKAKHLNYAQYKIPQPPTNKCSHCSKMHITFKSVWIYKFKQKQQVAVEVYILLHAWWSLAVVCFYYLQKFYTSLFVETVTNTNICSCLTFIATMSFSKSVELIFLDMQSGISIFHFIQVITHV